MEVIETQKDGLARFTVTFGRAYLVDVLEKLEQEVKNRNNIAKELLRKFNIDKLKYTFKPTEYACFCQFLAFYDLWINPPNLDVEKVQTFLLN